MAKKSFTDNPALQFISTPDPEPAQEQPTTESHKGKALDESRLDEIRALIPEGFKLVPQRETKSKRLQLVITPTLYNKLKAAADTAGLSINEYTTQAIIEKIGE